MTYNVFSGTLNLTQSINQPLDKDMLLLTNLRDALHHGKRKIETGYMTITTPI